MGNKPQLLLPDMLLLEPQFTPQMLPLVPLEPSAVKILISLKVKMAEFRFRTTEMLSMLSLLMSKQAMVSFMSSMLSFCNFKYKPQIIHSDIPINHFVKKNQKH